MQVHDKPSWHLGLQKPPDSLGGCETFLPETFQSLQILTLIHAYTLPCEFKRASLSQNRQINYVKKQTICIITILEKIVDAPFWTRTAAQHQWAEFWNLVSNSNSGLFDIKDHLESSTDIQNNEHRCIFYGLAWKEELKVIIAELYLSDQVLCTLFLTK